MTQTKPQKPQRVRIRGVILTTQGKEKLQQAKADAEFQENAGHKFTLEALSARTNLSVDTLMKVLACEAGVDKNTLKGFFRAFNLVLETNDYYYPPPAGKEPEEKLPVAPPAPEFPDGPVPLNSPFYIERPPLEEECYKAILQSGALIRIKAPRRMGKTSLMTRILQQASKEGYRTVSLDFQEADNAVYANLDKFLRWFCANVSRVANIPNRLEDYWDDLFGSKVSCKIYFEQYLLAKIEQPLVLALDKIDQLFQYPELADDFFGLLRAWHEESKNREIWQKLRLIVVHSLEVYIPLNINQSPFNVGLPIELPEFTLEQVQELAERYDLELSVEQVKQLMTLVGGYPFLVKLALYHIWRKDVTLEHLLLLSTTAISEIYGDYLQRQLLNLQQTNSGLMEAFTKVVIDSQPVKLNLVQAFKLQSLGLVHLQGNQVLPSCQLYAQYFRTYLSGNV